MKKDNGFKWLSHLFDKADTLKPKNSAELITVAQAFDIALRAYDRGKSDGASDVRSGFDR